jgi:predicted Zn finger-like uncharacterized protein
MNLITTCPSCLSQYSVSPETLRIADGWVGCGQCGYVYDATKTLKNVPVLRQDPHVLEAGAADTPAPPGPAMDPPPPPAKTVAHVQQDLEVLPQREPHAPLAEPESQEPLPVASGLADLPDRLPQEELAPQTPADSEPAANQTLSVQLREAMALESPASASVPAPDIAVQEADPAPSPEADPVLRLDEPTEPGQAATALRTAQLQTLRHEAEKPSSPDLAARFDPWKDDEPPLARPSRKMAGEPAAAQKDWSMFQSVILSLLIVLSIFQVMMYHRDWLSSTVPALRPALQQACAVLKCKVHSWRNIDAVVIQHASLTQNDAGYYKMSLAVKNTSEQKVAMPAVELSLLDANGAIMLRRVLSPEDLRAPEILAQQKVWEAEWMIQIAVPLPLSNYKIQVLYP